jgi:hypothetical protein
MPEQTDSPNEIINTSLEVNPKEVWESDFRVPEVIGQGTGYGFGFTGLHLPCEWENMLDNIKKVSPQRVYEHFNEECKVFGYEIENIAYDPRNILTKFSIIGNKDPLVQAQIELASSFPNNEKGLYITQNITDIREAYLIQHFVAQNLDHLAGFGKYAYVCQGVEEFYSQNLSIPKYLLDSKEQITNEYFQDNFPIKASNIAGRFGLDLEMCQFDERGLLQCARVTGNRCDYNFDNMGYYPHNVDSLSQAFALHTIVARYINHLLDMEQYRKEEEQDEESD